MAFECMDDCIHLKACRRIQRIGKNLRLNVPRYCTAECSAYVSGNDNSFLSAEDACYTARIQYDGRSDPYDVYCSHDFQTKTLKEIVDELQEGGGDDA